MYMIDDQEIDTEISSTQTTTEPESTQETARAVWEELQSGIHDEPEADDGIQGDQGAEPKAEAAAEKTIDPSEAGRALANAKRKAKKRQTFVPAEKAAPMAEAPKAEASEAPIEPPHHFPVPLKEKFLKLPRDVQQRAVEMFTGLEQNVTQRLHQTAELQRRHQGIDAVMSRYGKTWIKEGFSDEQFIAESAETWQGLRNDPVGTLAKIAQAAGVSPDDIAEAMNGGGQQRRNFSQPQAQTGLTPEQVRAILREERETQARQSLQQTAKAEALALMNERDQNGTYKYPELWDQSFQARVQPLVDYHLASQPGISFGEAVKRAVYTSRGQPLPGNSTPGTQSGTGSRLTPQEIQAAKLASTSVRSRGNGVQHVMSDVKPGESVRESAAAAYRELFGNKH